ncbi:MAG: hypothetical protein M0Q44_01770 [Methylobacter sp.]|jgi:hypothetical protein|nr:hypothetical protein [Methylobacter sp.]
MKVAVFLKMLLKAIKRISGVAGFVLCCSIPAYAGTPKAFDKPAPAPNLILTLPDQWLAAEKSSPSITSNVLAHHNGNETQTFALKRKPVNVDCDMDVVQNTLGDAPLSNRFFGECDLHYHY